MPRRPWTGSFLDSLRDPLGLGETQTGERVLASARAFFAIGSVLATFLDPATPTPYSKLARALLVLYAVYGILLIGWMRRRRDLERKWVLRLHALDILWPVTIASSIRSLSLPSFVLLLFPLMSAAFRWGLRRTLETAASTVLLLSLGAAFLSPAVFHFSERGAQFSMSVKTSAVLFMLAAALGYLSERSKQLRNRSLLIERIAGSIQPEAGLRETVGQILRAFVGLFEADQAVVAVREAGGGRIFRWIVRGASDIDSGLSRFSEPASFESELALLEQESYFFEVPGQSWYLRRPRPEEPYRFLALDREGNRLPDVACSIPQGFFASHAFRSVFAVPFTLGNEFSGRLFLFEPRPPADLESELRLLQNLVRDLAPALHGVYLYRLSRGRARHAEQGRLAEELHDQVLRSLIAAEARLEALRRHAEELSAGTCCELGSIQQLLRQEIVRLRELSRKLLSLDLGPRRFLDLVAEMVDQFRRETGIAASVASDWGGVPLPPRVCHELAAIIREALANVQRQDGVRSVAVRFTSEDACRKLVIVEDTHNTGSDGGVPLDLLQPTTRPSVIEERVRSIGGELTCQSNNGRGSRLEVVLPRKLCE